VVISPHQDTGAHTEYHSQVGLEMACLVEMGYCFLAQHTPLLTSPLINIFGETGIFLAAFDQVLNGTFHLPVQCDPFAKKFLAALALDPCILTIQPQMPQSYQQGWQHSQEATSSFVHYIVGTFNPKILIINTTLADTPLLTGFI